MIYLAAPYTHQSTHVRSARVTATGHVVSKYMEKGIFLYSPILHGHYVEMSARFEHHWEAWMAHSFAAISKCKEIVVLQLPGWATSKGVSAEIDFANQRGYGVGYINPVECKKLIPSHLYKIMDESAGVL